VADKDTPTPEPKPAVGPPKPAAGPPPQPKPAEPPKPAAPASPDVLKTRDEPGSPRGEPEPKSQDGGDDAPAEKERTLSDVAADIKAVRENPPVQRADGGVGPVAQPQPFNPATTPPSRLHGSVHRNRQDDGLDKDAVVEQVLRDGTPENGWVDFDSSEGPEALRELVEKCEADKCGINLFMGHGQAVGQHLARELRAGATPARLVRIPRARMKAMARSRRERDAQGQEPDQGQAQGDGGGGAQPGTPAPG
jgi:hypothetical protein